MVIIINKIIINKVKKKHTTGGVVYIGNAPEIQGMRYLRIKHNDYFTFIPAAVINKRKTEETANSARTLPAQIANIQPAFFHREDSVVALVMSDFSSEDIITPPGIHQDHRDNEQRTD